MQGVSNLLVQSPVLPIHMGANSVQQAEHSLLWVSLQSAAILCHRGSARSGLSSEQTISQAELHSLTCPIIACPCSFPPTRPDSLILPLPNSPSPIPILIQGLSISPAELWTGSHVQTIPVQRLPEQHGWRCEHGLCLAYAALASIKPKSSLELISAELKCLHDEISLCCSFL